MRILSLVLICSVLFFGWMVGHPHGPGFKTSCGMCHSTKGWQFDKEIYSFDHTLTDLPLTGAHTTVDCRSCHPTLIFTDAKSGCADCHTDVHQGSAGSDCARCHTPVSWLVKNITEIHQLGRFPLLGAHRTADCFDCHKSETHARFDVQGVDCIDCHNQDYLATTNPNHTEAGFSQDCSACHPVNSLQWTGAGFNHGFFPLVQGHSGITCSVCHSGGNYSSTPSDCFACHKGNFDSATNPNHKTSGFPTDCTICHTLNPGWQPASFTLHDSRFFPIYSGRHKGQWDTCTDCHTNQSDFSQFSCLTCHEHNKTDMDNRHRGENGYSYNSPACLNCHPRGNSD